MSNEFMIMTQSKEEFHTYKYVLSYIVMKLDTLGSNKSKKNSCDSTVTGVAGVYGLATYHQKKIR